MFKLSKDQVKQTVELAARGYYNYCRKNGIHYGVVGASGGLDSATVLGLAQVACKMAAADGYALHTVGITMPCESNQQSLTLGREAIRKFGADEMHIDMTMLFQIAAGKYPIDALIDEVELDGDERLLSVLRDFKKAQLIPNINEQVRNILLKHNDQAGLKAFDDSAKIAQGNTKARLRMMFGTYHIARMLKSGIVLSTDNLSEFWMAFWTICGDVGDFAMIQKMLKGLELYDIAEYLGVPEGTLKALPDDGLGIGNGDADQIGAFYPEVDTVMIYLIQHGFDPDGDRAQLENLMDVPGHEAEVVRKIATRAINGTFKRHGTYVMTRAELGLPEIEEIEL